MHTRDTDETSVVGGFRRAGGQGYHFLYLLVHLQNVPHLVGMERKRMDIHYTAESKWGGCYTRGPAPHTATHADMEAVKKAASGAVDSIRNSPLFRRKFGTQQGREVEQEPRHLSPEQDTTPFVQGINFKASTRVFVSGARPVDIF